MPIRIQIDPTAKTATLSFTGSIGMVDFAQAREHIAREPGWSPQFAHILDFTEVTALELSTENIQKLAAATPVFDPTALQILVARPGSVHFGISRMFEIYADTRRNVHVVESIDQARALVAANEAPPVSGVATKPSRPPTRGLRR